MPICESLNVIYSQEMQFVASGIFRMKMRLAGHAQDEGKHCCTDNIILLDEAAYTDGDM